MEHQERFGGMDTVLDYLQEVEKRAEDVLGDRRQVQSEHGDTSRNVQRRRAEDRNQVLKQIRDKMSQTLGDPSYATIVELDMKRNQNREALRALSKDTDKSDTVTVCFGSMFIDLPKHKTKEMIQRDQEQLDKEIFRIHSQLKGKVNQLYEAQGKPELKGFNLTALDPDEMKAMNKVLSG